MPVVVRWASEDDGMMQTVLVLAIVAFAAAFVLRRAWVTLRRAKQPAAGACGDCGCGKT